MKKPSILIISLLCGLCLSAQHYDKSYGIKLSPGFATLYNSPLSDLSTIRFSKSAGIEIRKRLMNNILYLETGVHVMDRGYRLTFDESNWTNGTVRTLRIKEIHYFATIPVAAVLKYKGLYISGGISPGYLLRRRFVVNGSLNSTDRKYLRTPFLLSTRGTAGYERQIADNWMLSGEMYLSPGVASNYFNMGFSLGLKYLRWA